MTAPAGKPASAELIGVMWAASVPGVPSAAVHTDLLPHERWASLGSGVVGCVMVTVVGGGRSGTQGVIRSAVLAYHCCARYPDDKRLPLGAAAEIAERLVRACEGNDRAGATAVAHRPNARIEPVAVQTATAVGSPRRIRVGPVDDFARFTVDIELTWVTRAFALDSTV